MHGKSRGRRYATDDMAATRGGWGGNEVNLSKVPPSGERGGGRIMTRDGNVRIHVQFKIVDCLVLHYFKSGRPTLARNPYCYLLN